MNDNDKQDAAVPLTPAAPLTPELLQLAIDGLNVIERKLVDSLAFVEAALDVELIKFLRARIAYSLGDHLELIAKLLEKQRADGSSAKSV